MHHTLVAVFDNRSDAQRALDELLASGFSRNDVRLSGADGAGASAAEDDELGIGGGIRGFFGSLFGIDSSAHARRYEGAVIRGQHVVTLVAASLPEVERAADLIERYGPIDIDEHAEGGGVRIFSHVVVTRVEESEGLPDDDYFRNHYTSNYGACGASYDDYAPAYSYGAQMAGSGRYAGRQWDEVESDLRSEWDSRDGSGGQSTWERMKAAVRHGWERIRVHAKDGRSH